MNSGPATSEQWHLHERTHRRPVRRLAPLTTGVPTVLLAVLLTTVLLPAPWGPPAVDAQDVPCLGCSFDVGLVTHNRSTPPGEFGRATIRIDNTGQFEDSYTLHVTSSDPSWLAEADRDAVTSVPPGTGPLASGGNSTTFDVSYVAPVEGRAGASTTIAVRVTSQGMDEDAPEAERVKSVTFTPEVAAMHSWTLDCDGTVPLAKAREAQVRFLIVNEGNAPGTVTIRHDTHEAVVVSPPAATSYSIGVGDRANGTYVVGASLRLQDGDVPFHLSAVLANGTTDETQVAQCTTTLRVAAGDGSGPTGGADDGAGGTTESNGAHGLLPLLAMVVFLARGRARASTAGRFETDARSSWVGTSRAREHGGAA